VFRYSESEDAFRLMQASGHIGKIVLVPDAQSEAMVRDQPRFTARRDGTYLVTGGIDGFGFEAARWLAENGAGAIALVSRRGSQTPRCAERVAELEAAGAAVQVYRGDIGDRASVAQLLDELRAVQPPLRGVVHAAAVIEDRLTADLAPSDVAAVLRPKIDGALALDELTREDPIELFLLFSSATTLLGAPGQGAYVAANAALEALARRRHTEGRPALAVMWGPIADAGYLAERPQAREALARRLGALPVPAAEALAALPAMLASGLPVVAYAAPVWGETARALPILAAPLFSEVREGGGVVEDDGLLDRLRHLEAGAAQTLLRNIVLEEAGRILRQPADEIDPAQPLSQMGMDSLMAVELRLALEGRLRVDLPLVSLAEGTSVTSIATRLANALALGDGAAEIAALAERHLAPEESVMALDDAAAPKSAAE
jgi:NAD(P)-dependent dehydrogenase (short-subunit alcohol dehydrogenase family)/acyl carrier protein